MIVHVGHFIVMPYRIDHALIAIYHLSKYNGVCPGSVTLAMHNHLDTYDCIIHASSGLMMFGPKYFILATMIFQSLKWALKLVLEHDALFQAISFAQNVLMKFIDALEFALTRLESLKEEHYVKVTEKKNLVACDVEVDLKPKLGQSNIPGKNGKEIRSDLRKKTTHAKES